MKLIACLLFILGYSADAFGGGEVGNGGDILACEYSTENDLQGYYTLDFFLTREWQRPGLETVPVINARANLERVASRLAKVDSKLAADLKEFLVSHYEPDVLSKRQWLPSAETFIDIRDEQLLSLIPFNCIRYATNTPRLLQTVVRRTSGANTHYHFYKPMFDELAKYRPLQLSVLLMHEWLWDYLDNAESIRLVGFTLHTDWLENTSAENLKKALHQWGLLK